MVIMYRGGETGKHAGPFYNYSLFDYSMIYFAVWCEWILALSPQNC